MRPSTACARDAGALAGLGADRRLPARAALPPRRAAPRPWPIERELTVLAGDDRRRPGRRRGRPVLRRRIGGAGRSDRRPAVDPLGVVAAGRTRIVTASDADEEVRAAVRAVVDAVRGGHARSIAWPSCTPARSPTPGWPTSSCRPPASRHNGAAVMPLTARVAGRTLLGLLALPDGRLPPRGRLRLAGRGPGCATAGARSR